MPSNLPQALEELLKDWLHDRESCDLEECDEIFHEQCGHFSNMCTRCRLMDAWPRIEAQVRLAVAHELEEPYPETIFTPLPDAEIEIAVKAMESVVPHASSRLHAGWARHWAKVLRERVATLEAELAAPQADKKEST